MEDYRQNPSDFNRGLALLVLGLLAFVYLYRLDFLAPRWEEPRRCMVAFEMIERGDYIVPTVYNEVYTKKPPLQNWIIAALAGFDTRRVHVLLPRLVTVFSVFATAALISWLRGSMLGAVVFLTLGIQIQYGRSAAIDPLFVLFTTGALVTFYWGRTHNNPWVAWIPSQFLIGLGVLTKGLAPAFVYPPLLLWMLVERRRGEARPVGVLPLILGAVLLAAVVGAWIVPMATSDAFSELQSTGASEVLSRTPAGAGLGGFFAGLARFPVEVAANLLPWSLLVLTLPWTKIRVVRAWSEDSLFRFSVVAVAWICGLLWLMPGSLGRYVMPAYPFFALGVATLLAPARVRPVSRRRWWALWLLLGVVWIAFASYRAMTKPDVILLGPLIAAVGAVILAGSLRRVSPATTALALLGFLYALYFATIHAPSRAGWDRDRRVEIARMVELIRQDAERRELDVNTVPLGCSHGLNQAVCFEIMKHFDRSMTRPERNTGPSYTVGNVDLSPRPDDRITLAENRFRLELWYRDAP